MIYPGPGISLGKRVYILACFSFSTYFFFITAIHQPQQGILKHKVILLYNLTKGSNITNGIIVYKVLKFYKTTERLEFELYNTF